MAGRIESRKVIFPLVRLAEEAVKEEAESLAQSAAVVASCSLRRSAAMEKTFVRRALEGEFPDGISQGLIRIKLVYLDGFCFGG